MSFSPDKADPEKEAFWESQGLPEEDRDELRRMAMFLARREARKAGKELPPLTEGMRQWILGTDL